MHALITPDCSIARTGAFNAATVRAPRLLLFVAYLKGVLMLLAVLSNKAEDVQGPTTLPMQSSLDYDTGVASMGPAIINPAAAES